MWARLLSSCACTFLHVYEAQLSSCCLRADMLAGRLPFVEDAGALTRRDLAAITGARWFLPPGLQLSDDCRDLLGKLLAADPKQRLRRALC